MPNVSLTNSVITNDALAVFRNNLAFAKLVNRDYQDQFAKTGAKIGSTVNIRKPVRYLTTTGPLMAVQSSVESSVPLTIDTQRHVDMSFSSAELALDIDRFSQRYVVPAMTALANAVDADGLRQALNVNAAVGTAGVTPSTFSVYLDADVKLTNQGAPIGIDMRSVITSPQAQATIVNNNLNLFNDRDELSYQYRNGLMRTAMGYTWGMDQNVFTHTVGPLGGTPVVNVAGQTGSTLNTRGWTAAIGLRLRKGDVFTIANVFSVNPVSYQSTGQLQQFVVTADATSDGAGNAAVGIFPAIVTSGTMQSVTVAPADGAAITVMGASGTVTPQNLAFTREAFTLAMVDLEDVSGMGAKCTRKSDTDSGVAIRMVEQYTIGNDQAARRLDILYGWATIRPEWAVRIYG